MSDLDNPSVNIQTFSYSASSIPSWFGELTLLAHSFHTQFLTNPTPTERGEIFTSFSPLSSFLQHNP